MEQGNLPPYDRDPRDGDLEDPTKGLTPVEEDMPYGWWSPTLGRRGWFGAILWCVMTVLVTEMDLPWWQGLIAGALIVALCMEPLRTDAIKRHGAISLEYVREAGILDAINDNPSITAADLSSQVPESKGHWFWGDDHR
jgi:hypothetical protein